MIDLLVANGTVVDGSGRPAFVANVAVDGGLIVGVGPDTVPARRRVDASDCIVTPGFVDPHTHFDAQVTWDECLTPSCWHGVTTAVMGNCGVGFAPAAEDKRDWLIGLMEGVEDISGADLRRGIRWGWETFPQYLDALERGSYAMDVATQVPHGAVRVYVMGERGTRDVEPTAEELDALQRIVGGAIEAGALGLSSSRTTNHLAVDGRPVPGTFASHAELDALARSLRGRILQVVPPETVADPGVVDREVGWMEDVSRRHGCTVAFTLLQSDRRPREWERWLELATAANRRGARLRAEVCGRPFGMLVGFRVAHPFGRRPSFQTLEGLPEAEWLARLRSPEVRAGILAESPVGGNLRSQQFPWDLSRIFVLGDPLDYEPAEEASVAAIASASGRPEEEVLYDLLLEDDARRLLFRPILGYSELTLEPMREMMTHPLSIVSLTDAGAHSRLICDASMPTSLLAHWVRDRARGPRLPLEQAVKMLTSAPCEVWGLEDRGLIAPGRRADLNVIDLAHLRLHRPEVVSDLPAGGKRLIQRAAGFRATIVAGVVTFVDGIDQGARPGRLLRGPRRS